MTAAPPPGLTLEELASRQGRSEQATLELLRPFLKAGIVAERAGRLVVVARLVAAAFAPPGPAELAGEEPPPPPPPPLPPLGYESPEPLTARIASYLERNRDNPQARGMTAIVNGVRGEKGEVRACVRAHPEFFADRGTPAAQRWELTSWANGRGVVGLRRAPRAGATRCPSPCPRQAAPPSTRGGGAA